MDPFKDEKAYEIKVTFGSWIEKDQRHVTRSMFDQFITRNVDHLFDGYSVSYAEGTWKGCKEDTWVLTVVGGKPTLKWAIKVAFISSAVQVGAAVLLISLTMSEFLRGFSLPPAMQLLDSDRVVVCAVVIAFLCMPSFRMPFDEAAQAEEEAFLGTDER